jgi:hypothetical protein
MATTKDSSAAAEWNDEELCDLLTVGELSSQVTELLLAIVPPLTGEQILAIRGRLTEFAEDRGWLVSGIGESTKLVSGQGRGLRLAPRGPVLGKLAHKRFKSRSAIRKNSTLIRNGHAPYRRFSRPDPHITETED